MLTLRPDNKGAISSDFDLSALCKMWTFDPDAWSVAKATDLLETCQIYFKEEGQVITLEFPDEWYLHEFAPTLVPTSEENYHGPRNGNLVYFLPSLDFSRPRKTEEKEKITEPSNPHWWEEAMKRFGEAKELYVLVGDRQGQARCIWSIGEVEQLCRRNEEALKCFEEANALFLLLEDEEGQARCIYSIGEVERLRRRNKEALKCFEEAKELYVLVGDRQGGTRKLWSTSRRRRRSFFSWKMRKVERAAFIASARLSGFAR
ncbi:hypothetical protein BT69DRAFT_1344953 [Atractiella rhizophila]|nr:hypothetical protein BT69DRAFT_1344953 [Atractiella rhizophila]